MNTEHKEIGSEVDSLATRVSSAIASVAGSAPVALHEPVFKGNESMYLQECIDTTYVSSVGKFVDRFEQELAEFTGAGFAVAVVNGTAALQVALLLAGVKAGDEVLIPTLSFVATANAVSYCRAIPHFVDSESNTLGMAANPLREHLEQVSEQRDGACVNKSTGCVIRAIVPMHTFGHAADIEALASLAREFNLVMVEDAAESLGSYCGGVHTGTFGLLGILSFNGNKIITTGGGGAILTDSESLARRAKHLTTTARIRHEWVFEHDEAGFNYRMPNLNAALGCAQLERLSEILRAKRELYECYRTAFQEIEGVRLVAEPSGCESNYWLQTLLLDDAFADQRDSVLEVTNEAGMMTRPAWRLLHQLPPYLHCPRAPLPVAENLERRIINIPSSAFLA